MAGDVVLFDHRSRAALDRPLPQSPDAERAVLGSILINNGAFDRVGNLIGPDDFFKDGHRSIFAAMRSLAGETREIDLLTLKEELNKRSQLEHVGGSAYISSLIDGIPDVANVERYARIVKEKSMLRRLVVMGNSVMRAALDPPNEPEEVFQFADRVLREIGENLPDSRSLKNTGTGMSVVRTWEESEPEPMRYVVDGLVHESHLAGIFGDGGSGKSYLAGHLGACAATGGDFLGRRVAKRNVLFLDWELEASEFLRRMYRVARGMGFDRIPEGIHYAQLSTPLTNNSVFDFCQKAVEETGSSLIIVDSFAPASCASDQVAPSEIVPFMQRLRQLGTVVVLDHVPKPVAAAGAPLRAYGSAFKHNLVRSSLRLERGDGGGMRLMHMKNNFGRLSEPITFAMVHTFDAVRFEQIDANDERLAGLAERKRTVPDQILDELAQFGEDGASPARLAEIIGCSSKTISNHLSQLRASQRIEQAHFGYWRIAGGVSRYGRENVGNGKVKR
jgi:hypothetical protein